MHDQGYKDAFHYNVPLHPDDPLYMEGWGLGCKEVEEEYYNQQPRDDDDYDYDEEDEDY